MIVRNTCAVRGAFFAHRNVLMNVYIKYQIVVLKRKSFQTENIKYVRIHMHTYIHTFRYIRGQHVRARSYTQIALAFRLSIPNYNNDLKFMRLFSQNAFCGGRGDRLINIISK